MELGSLILDLAKKHGEVRTRDVLAGGGKVSRQYVSKVLSDLVRQGKLVKGGKTKDAVYAIPENAIRVNPSVVLKLTRQGLQEDEVLEEIKLKLVGYMSLRTKVKKAFEYAFSEMLNNAIDHSESVDVEVRVAVSGKNVEFEVIDEGVGLFANVAKKRDLKSELEAVQDILKGKTTTAPDKHSGEGIFFSSKLCDLFMATSHDTRLRVDNKIPDIFVQTVRNIKGTAIFWALNLKSKVEIANIFEQYQSDPQSFVFDQTSVQVRLYSMNMDYVSRSQARRLLTGLEKFSLITLDFERIENIGQGFADEVFRVFAKNHQDIKIEYKNTNRDVDAMIQHVKR